MFDSFTLRMLAALISLALVRMLSEVRISGIKERGIRVNFERFLKKVKQTIRISRKFWQYLLETIWAIGAGALVSPLAS
jgi:hypothetical protein